MPVDPAFLPVINAPRPAPDPNADPVATVRAGMGALFTHPNPPAVSVTNTSCLGPGGDIPLRIFHPGGRGASRPVVVFFHGGGFLAGNLDTHDGTCRELAVASNAIVVSVDYRLAPEAVFPAAVEDCYAALLWVSAHARTFGGDPYKLALAGDSAGGNLTATVALMNRDRGGPRLAMQVLIYPVIDPALDTESSRSNGEGFMLTWPSMMWMWSTYLGGTADSDSPYAMPTRAGSLAGLPPAVVITAEYDPLRDEGELYGALLQRAGVRALVRRYDGMLHGFFSMHVLTPVARQAARFVGEELGKAFRSTSRG